MNLQYPSIRLALATAILVVTGACADRISSEQSPVASTADSAASQMTQGAVSSKTTAPIEMQYEIQGSPTIGEPLTIDVYLTPTVAATEMRARFDAGEGLELVRPSDSILMSPPKAGTVQVHTVTVVPWQEGRFYVGVVASIKVGGVEQSRAFSIPVQVAASVGRVLGESNGRLMQDEEGNPIVSLPAEDRGQ